MGFIGTVEFHEWKMRAPTATTLSGVSQSQIQLVSLLLVESDRDNFYLWIGTRKRWGVPSGPSAYAFGVDGKLIDWGIETDDGRSIDYYYQQRRQGVEISIEHALRNIDSLSLKIRDDHSNATIEQ
jgi:hypothetical protein